MREKHSYRTQDVEKIQIAALIPLLTAGCILAIDVAKTKFVAGFATLDGAVQTLFRFNHPWQTPALLSLLRQLISANIRPQVVMEPTGVYGDTVRYQCQNLGCEVFMVRPKLTHDMSEVIDGVPSSHDGKAVHILAQLHAMKKSSAWTPPSEKRRELRALVDRRQLYCKLLEPVRGHLEALLSKQWPGFGSMFDLEASKSARALLLKYGDPHTITAHQAEARALLSGISRRGTGWEKIDHVIESAKNTLSEPPIEAERKVLLATVAEFDRLKEQIDSIDQMIEPVVSQYTDGHAASADGHGEQENDLYLGRIAQVGGVALAAAIVAFVGSPKEYGSAKAFEKALGLNLKIRQSGEHKGKLSITKRGNSEVRRLLYLAALREIQTSRETAAWYRERRAFKAGMSQKAVVAVMRKLAKAIWHVAMGNPFDRSKLYDLNRLNLQETISPKALHKTDGAPTQSTPTMHTTKVA